MSKASDTDQDIQFVGFGSSPMSSQRRDRLRLPPLNRFQRKDNHPTAFILTSIIDGPVGSINCASETYYRQQNRVIYVGRAHTIVDGQDDSGKDRGNGRKEEDKESINAIFKSDVMSRQHCKFAFGDNGEICVTDLASHHGTFVSTKPPTTLSRTSNSTSHPTPPPSYSDIFWLGSHRDRSKDNNGENNKSSNGGVFKKLTPYIKYALHDGDQIRFGKDVFKSNQWYYAITVSLKLLYPHSQTQSQPNPQISASRRLPSDVISIISSPSRSRSPAPPPSSASASASIPALLQPRKPTIKLTLKSPAAKSVSTYTNVPNGSDAKKNFTGTEKATNSLKPGFTRVPVRLISKPALASSANSGAGTTSDAVSKRDKIWFLLDAPSSASSADKDKDANSSKNADTNPNAYERRFIHIPTSNAFAAPLTVGTSVNGNGNKKTSNRYGLISPSPPSSLSPSPGPEADSDPDCDDSVLEQSSRDADNVHNHEDITSWDGRKSTSSMSPTSPVESVSMLTSDIDQVSELENTENQNGGGIDMDMEMSDHENESENAMPGSITGARTYEPSASNSLDSPVSVKSSLSEDSSDRNGSGDDDMLISDAEDSGDHPRTHIDDEARSGANDDNEEHIRVPFSRFSNFIPLHHSRSQPTTSTTTASFIFGSSNTNANTRPFQFQPLSTYFPSFPLPSSLPSLSSLNVPGLPKLNDIIPNVNNILPSVSMSFPGFNLGASINAGAASGIGYITTAEDTARQGDAVQSDGDLQTDDQNEKSALVIQPETNPENTTNLETHIARDEIANVDGSNASILVPEEALSSSNDDGSKTHIQPSELVNTDTNQIDTETRGEHGRSSLFERTYPADGAQDQVNADYANENFDSNSNLNAINNGSGNDVGVDNNRTPIYPWREKYGYTGTLFPRRRHHCRFHPHPIRNLPHNHGPRSPWSWSSHSSNPLGTHSHSEKYNPTLNRFNGDRDRFRHSFRGSGRRFNADSNADSNAASSGGVTDWKVVTDELFSRTSETLRDLGVDRKENALKSSFLHNPWRYNSTSMHPPNAAPPPPSPVSSLPLQSALPEEILSLIPSSAEIFGSFPHRSFEDAYRPYLSSGMRYLRDIHDNAGFSVVIDSVEDGRKRIRKSCNDLKGALMATGDIENDNVTEDRGYAQSPLPDTNQSSADVGLSVHILSNSMNDDVNGTLDKDGDIQNETTQSPVSDPTAPNSGNVVDNSMDDDPDNEGFYWSNAVWSNGDHVEVNSHLTNNVGINGNAEQSSSNIDAPFNSPLYPDMNENANVAALHVPNIVMPESLTSFNNAERNAGLVNEAQNRRNNISVMQGLRRSLSTANRLRYTQTVPINQPNVLNNTLAPLAEHIPLANPDGTITLPPPRDLLNTSVYPVPQSTNEIAALTSRITALQTQLVQIEQKLDDVTSSEQLTNLKRKRETGSVDEQDSSSSTPGSSSVKRLRTTTRPESLRSDFERISEVMLSRQRARVELAREMARRRRLFNSRSGTGIGMLAVAAAMGSIATWTALAFL